MPDLLPYLPPLEQRVLVLYYGLYDQQALPFEKIGEEYGVTRETIRRVERRAVRMLTKTLQSS